MPELPDVEYFKKKAEKALNQKIGSVNINADKLLKTAPQILKKHLSNKKITSLERHGKYLFMRVDKKYLMLHFGMTGSIEYWKKEKPKYSAMDISFANNHTLSIISRRKLGKIRLVDSPQQELKDIGEDALSVKKEEFVKILEKSRGYLKTTLMNQKKIAGIGNIYADEILYQSGIHPQRNAGSLKKEEMVKLYNKLKTVLKTAVKRNADPEKFPSGYLTPHRKEKKFKGKSIRNIKVNGRTTLYIPELQK